MLSEAATVEVGEGSEEVYWGSFEAQGGGQIPPDP